MRRYIYVKRKTVRRIAALTVFLIVVAAATIALRNYFLRKPVAMLETLSRNVLMADGKEQAYLYGVNADTVFTGLSLYKDSVRCAAVVSLHRDVFDRALLKTADSLHQRIDYIEGARREMGYYMSVHNVQDEGYDMVVAYDEQLKQQLDDTQRLLKAVKRASASKNATLLRTVVRTQETLIKPSGIALRCLGGYWKNGRWWRAASPQASPQPSPKGRELKASPQPSPKGRELWIIPMYNGIATYLISLPFGEGRGEALISLPTGYGKGEALISLPTGKGWGGAASGHGSFTSTDGTYYEGHWTDGKRDGFGFSVSDTKIRVGEWKANKYLGERMSYTSERIYGIDISKYQHGQGRKHYSIQWSKLRIAHLGKVGSRNVKGTVDYPVSFIYIKSTEGTTVRNRYFATDYWQARAHGFRTGAYHFFSLRSSATAQANFFIRHSAFRHGDMPPVLDLEPTDAQISKIGGAAALFRAVRTWLSIVHRRTGVRPVLYVGQRFVNKYLSLAPDIKRNYNVWIARYGEYKPDVKLVYWQLCPDGRVTGIHGDVDINVFNGYREAFDRFVANETVK